MSGGMSIAQRREALESACAALDGLPEQLWRLTGSELGPFLGLVDRLGQRVEGARVAVLGEAVGRGEVGGRAHEWLWEWAPSVRAGGSARIVRVVEAFAHDRYAGLRQAVVDGTAPVVNAAAVVEEFERIGHRLHPAAHEPVMELLVDLAATGRARDIRRVRAELVARYGHDGEFQAEQDRARAARCLSQPYSDGSGLYDYRLVVDAEAKALIEAAVGPLAAPRPVDGARDLRTSEQRRMDALLEVVRRGVAAPEGVPATVKTQVVVTMGYDDLVARTGAGTVLGSTAGGELLGPETVRKLACDAGVVPAVLGSSGELLDLGRRVRCFTAGQVRALWLRDRGCTLPGCTAPAAWADAHHLVHWADGGASDLANAALLCGRHHDVVHAKGFHGRVRGGQVEWDLTPGAYDHFLRTGQTSLTARDPEPADHRPQDLGATDRPPGDRGPTDPPGEMGRTDHPPDEVVPVEPPDTRQRHRTFDLWGEVESRPREAPPP